MCCMFDCCILQLLANSLFLLLLLLEGETVMAHGQLSSDSQLIKRHKVFLACDCMSCWFSSADAQLPVCLSRILSQTNELAVQHLR